MAVVLRLKRLGRRNRPFYRICVMDTRTRRDGRAIEELGHYDPANPEKRSDPFGGSNSVVTVGADGSVAQAAAQSCDPMITEDTPSLTCSSVVSTQTSPPA